MYTISFRFNSGNAVSSEVFQNILGASEIGRHVERSISLQIWSVDVPWHVLESQIGRRSSFSVYLEFRDDLPCQAVSSTENSARGGIWRAETSSFWTRDMYIEGRTAFNFYRGFPGRRLCSKNPNDRAYFQRPSRDQSYEIVKVSTTVLAVYY